MNSPHPQEHADSATRQANQNTKSSTEWLDPVPITAPAPPEFPVDAMPPMLANWVAEESIATQTPPDLAALLSLAVCAAALAKRVEVQAWPGWSEPCNLYVAGILEPGNRKSAVFADATSPLRQVESQLREDSAESVAEELSDYLQAEKRLAKLVRVAAEGADAIKRENAKVEAREISKKLATWQKPEEPTLIVDDATSEKLAILLQTNGERLASMSAEGGVFDLMAGKYSGGATDINVYLMAHSGDTVSVHRVTREPVHLLSPALTMALTIQPEVIKGIAKTPAFRGRGLLGRFLYAVPKSWIGHRKVRTPPVSERVSLAYAHTVKSLAKTKSDDDGTPRRIRLSDDAMDEFKLFCESLETELGYGRLEMIKDWGGKLAGATLRIAGILHCASHGGEACLGHDINLETIEAAQRIAKWAIPHAAAAFDLLAASDDEARDDAEYLLRWLRNRLPTETTFDRRDAQRHGHRRFDGLPQRLDNAIAVLERTNHIVKLDRPRTGGRVTYEVSPYIADLKANLQRPQGGDNGDDGTSITPPNPALSPLSPVSEDSKIAVAVTDGPDRKREVRADHAQAAARVERAPEREKGLI